MLLLWVIFDGVINDNFIPFLDILINIDIIFKIKFKIFIYIYYY